MRVLSHIISIGLFAFCMLTSCSMYDDDFGQNHDFESSIYGRWVDSTQFQLSNKQINTLTFNVNGSFVFRHELYEPNESNRLYEWSEFAGNYVLSSKQIYFVSKKQTQWKIDSYGNETNFTSARDSVIFDNCSYEISNDTLVLEYSTGDKCRKITTFKKRN